MISDNAWMAREAEEDPPITWIVDPGGRRYMTPDKSVFTSKWIVRTSVILASAEKLHAGGVRNPTFDMEAQTIRITNVLPDLDADLLSTPALNWNDLSALFGEMRVDVIGGDNLIVRGIIRVKMYYLHRSQTTFPSEAMLESYSGKSFGCREDQRDDGYSRRMLEILDTSRI